MSPLARSLHHLSSLRPSSLRLFSSRPFNGNTRGFPAYRIFGPDALFNVKPILPTFKAASADAFAVQREGKLLVELTPRTNGTFQWDKQVNFACSVEECALIQHQLPAGHPVEVRWGCRRRRRDSDRDHDRLSSLCLGSRFVGHGRIFLSSPNSPARSLFLLTIQLSRRADDMVSNNSTTYNSGGPDKVRVRGAKQRCYMSSDDFSRHLASLRAT